jgi:hypothetical protein
VVVDLPVEGLSAGVPIGAQSLFYERPLLASAGLSWGLGRAFTPPPLPSDG